MCSGVRCQANIKLVSLPAAHQARQQCKMSGQFKEPPQGCGHSTKAVGGGLLFYCCFIVVFWVVGAGNWLIEVSQKTNGYWVPAVLVFTACMGYALTSDQPSTVSNRQFAPTGLCDFCAQMAKADMFVKKHASCAHLNRLLHVKMEKVSHEVVVP